MRHNYQFLCDQLIRDTLQLNLHLAPLCHQTISLTFDNLQLHIQCLSKKEKFSMHIRVFYTL